MVFIGEVVDVYDEFGGERIRVRILPDDALKPVSQIPYAFPLLPKTFHSKPKVGEATLVICADDDKRMTQRYYLGPLISQPQSMYKDNYQLGATTLLQGSPRIPLKSTEFMKSADGTIAKDDETALYSRQNSDIILSNDDIRIRCGARLVNPNANQNNTLNFNKNNPAFIKLKYHESPLANPQQPNNKSVSTVSIVGDEINLLSNKSKDPLFGNNELTNPDGQITDESMQEIINKAHVLPYGDVLVDFLMAFLQMFKSHTHKYPGLPPCPDSYSDAMDEQYGRCGRKAEANDVEVKATGAEIEQVNNTFRGLYDKLLSKNVRIN